MVISHMKVPLIRVDYYGTPSKTHCYVIINQISRKVVVRLKCNIEYTQLCVKHTHLRLAKGFLPPVSVCIYILTPNYSDCIPEII